MTPEMGYIITFTTISVFGVFVTAWIYFAEQSQKKHRLPKA